MNQLLRFFALGLAVAFVCTPSALPAASLNGSKPNIVLIMPDDISFGSNGVYGGKTPSPNLDALYRKSLRFEDFHVSPTCSPVASSRFTASSSTRVGVVAGVSSGGVGWAMKG